MREERILNMLGEVEEKYISEADPTIKTRNMFPVWGRTAAVAACLCLVILAGRLAIPLIVPQDPSDHMLPLSVAAAELGMGEYAFGVSLPHIVYADSERVIMYDFRGIYVYNTAKCELTGFSDFRPIDMTLIQGSDPTFVHINTEGTRIRFFNSSQKYLYDIERNETTEVDDYADPFEEYHIKILEDDDPASLSDGQYTYVGVDGITVALDLVYEKGEEDQIRYKNLVLLVKEADRIKEYEIFR